MLGIKATKKSNNNNKKSYFHCIEYEYLINYLFNLVIIKLLNFFFLFLKNYNEVCYCYSRNKLYLNA